MNSFGDKAAWLVMHCLAGIPLHVFEDGTPIHTMLQDFSFRGCLYLEDGYITMPHHVLHLAVKKYGLPFTMHKISDNIHWQNFERVRD